MGSGFVGGSLSEQKSKSSSACLTRAFLRQPLDGNSLVCPSTHHGSMTGLQSVLVIIAAIIV